MRLLCVSCVCVCRRWASSGHQLLKAARLLSLPPHRSALLPQFEGESGSSRVPVSASTCGVCKTGTHAPHGCNRNERIAQYTTCTHIYHDVPWVIVILHRGCSFVNGTSALFNSYTPPFMIAWPLCCADRAHTTFCLGVGRCCCFWGRHLPPPHPATFRILGTETTYFSGRYFARVMARCVPNVRASALPMVMWLEWPIWCVHSRTPSIIYETHAPFRGAHFLMGD